ncbi:MAG: LexA regulated protein [Thalassotalea sp.]
MAKEAADLTTIDLFSEEKRPGRPRTNPHARSVQVRINKRNQVKRDKSKGLKRVEFKIHQALFEQLEQRAHDENVTRGQLIEAILTKALIED